MATQTVDTRKTLKELTAALRNLHQALVKVTQTDYERGAEPVNGPVELLQLLTTHPYFAWLHPLSALMVEVDEVLDEDPIPSERMQAVFTQLRSLLSQSGDTPSDFCARYLDAIHRDPAAVIAHSAVRRLIAP